MAEGLIILRPTADVSVEHTLPEGYVGAWALINDIEADSGSSCLSVYSDEKDGDSVSATTIVEIASDTTVRVKSIISVKVIYNCCVDLGNSFYANGSVVVKIGLNDVYSETFTWDGSETTDEGTVYVASYGEHIGELSATNSADFLSQLENYISANKGQIPKLQLSVVTNANGMSTSENSKGSSADAYASITQAYVEIVGDIITDIGITKKNNGAWKVATKAYQKSNGSWVETSEDECKSILQNSKIRQG